MQETQQESQEKRRKYESMKAMFASGDDTPLSN
jgi:hypothetical protein